jgi:hypothetical protein
MHSRAVGLGRGAAALRAGRAAELGSGYVLAMQQRGCAAALRADRAAELECWLR